MQDRKLEFVIKDTALPYKQVFKSHHICHSNLIELRFRLYEKIRLLSVSSSVFLEDFQRSTLAEKEEYENPRKSLPKKRKKYSTSPFLVVLLKVTSQKPRYYKSPVTRVFTFFIRLYIPLIAQVGQFMDRKSAP